MEGTYSELLKSVAWQVGVVLEHKSTVSDSNLVFVSEVESTLTIALSYIDHTRYNTYCLSSLVLLDSISEPVGI